MFVAQEIDGIPFDANLNGRDLAVEIPSLDCGCGAILALQRKDVLIGSADPVFSGHVFGGHPHVASAKRTIQRAEHHVSGFHVAHLGAPPLIRDDIGAAAHVFCAASKGKFSVAQLQGLNHRHNRLHAGPAKAVHVHRRGTFRDTCLHRGNARKVHVARFGIDHVPYRDMADLIRCHAGPIKRRRGNGGAKINRACTCQSAAKGTDCGARATQNYDISHVWFSPFVAGTLSKQGDPTSETWGHFTDGVSRGRHIAPIARLDDIAMSNG